MLSICIVISVKMFKVLFKFPIIKKEGYKMKRYYVIDVYEDIEVIGTTDNLDTALDMEHERTNDTDGECAVWIYDTTLEKNINKLKAWGII